MKLKRFAIYLIFLFVSATLTSCGSGSSSSLGSAPTQTPEYQLKVDKLAFDLTNQSNPIIPLPNDLLWAQTGGYLYLSDPDASPQMQAVYKAINLLHDKGVSPLAPIAIPLATNEIQLDPSELKNNVKVIDLTEFVSIILKQYLTSYIQAVPNDQTCYALAMHPDNQTLAVACFANVVKYYYSTAPAKLIQTIQQAAPLIYAPLIVKQNGNVINAYPTKPLNPGHQYVGVVLNGIKNLQEASMFKMLLGDQQLTGQYAQLEPLREKYLQVAQLLQTLGISKDNILELFTFTTADKTLGLKDYAAINAYLQGKEELSPNTIKGYSYTNLASDNQSNEYYQIDQLSDLPLVCQAAYDNETLRALFNLPEITDMQSYFLSVNVYNLAAVEHILALHPITVTSNVPVVCKAIFDNVSLYDKVPLALANPQATGGILIFQHGLGKSKADIYQLKDDFSNYYIIGMDLPWHGDRIPPNPTLAGLCDSTASGACYLTTNAIMDVLNIYQSILDMHTLLKLTALMDYTVMPQLIGNRLPIYFASQSMGSITGSILLSVDQNTRSQFFDALAAKLSMPIPDHGFIARADLNVGGAVYSSILNEATNRLILNMLTAAGVERGNMQDFLKYYMTLYIFQTLLDPADPAYLARNSAVKDKIILQSANHDTVVPNISNELLSIAMGYNTYTPIDCSSTTTEVPAVAGWYMFGTGDNWVNHGFFVTTENLSYKYPEAIAHLNQTYVDNAQYLARKQAREFFTLFLGNE